MPFVLVCVCSLQSKWKWNSCGSRLPLWFAIMSYFLLCITLELWSCEPFWLYFLYCCGFKWGDYYGSVVFPVVWFGGIMFVTCITFFVNAWNHSVDLLTIVDNDGWCWRVSCFLLVNSCIIHACYLLQLSNLQSWQIH